MAWATGRLLVFVVLGVVFGPIAVLAFKIVSNPRGRHQRRARDSGRGRRSLPRHAMTDRRDQPMTTQQPEPRHDDGGPERVHPGNVEGDVVNGDKVEGDIVEGDEVDNDPNDPDDDDTDAPGHRREDDESNDGE